MTPSPVKPRGRWFQFRLRTLLGLMLVIVLLLGAWRLLIEPYQRQKKAMALIEELGGYCQTSATAAPWITRVLRWDEDDIVLVDLAGCDEPAKYVGAIARLPVLEILVVGGEKFTDEHLRELLRLDTLRGLVLDSTNVTDEGFSDFQRARPRVDVYRSQRRAAQVLHSLYVRVEELYDAHPDLSQAVGYDYFREVTWLRYFSPYPISSAKLDALARMPQLRELELDWSGLTDEDLEKLEGLRNLRMLSLGGTQISDEGLKHLYAMNQLEEIWLHDTAITDLGLVHLTRLPSLRFLFLYNTQVSDEGLSRLGQMTRLERLWLYGTQVTDSGLKHLRGMTNLRELTLHNTRVTPAGAADLRQALPDCVVEGIP